MTTHSHDPFAAMVVSEPRLTESLSALSSNEILHRRIDGNLNLDPTTADHGKMKNVIESVDYQLKLEILEKQNESYLLCFMKLWKMTSPRFWSQGAVRHPVLELASLVLEVVNLLHWREYPSEGCTEPQSRSGLVRLEASREPKTRVNQVRQTS